MKKLIIIFCFTLVYFNLVGQAEFAPLGAKWYYTAPYTGDCIKLNSVSDTIIEELNYRVVEFRFCKDNSLISREFFHQQGDSIFYYNYYHESIHLLYDFGAKIDDTVIVHKESFKPTEGFYDPQNRLGSNDSVPFFSYRVESKDSIMENGMWLNKFELYSMYRSEANIGFHRDFPAIEKLGATNYIFGRHLYIHTQKKDHRGMLRCYFDDEIEYVNPSWEYPCDTSITTSIDNKSISDDLKLYPNPVKNGKIFVESPKIISNVAIYNEKGEILRVLQPVDYNVMIDVEGLKSGIYILTFTFSDKTKKTYKRLIKL